MPKSKIREVVEETIPATINKTEVAIQSLIDSHLTYIGKVSGRQYGWARAGDTVLVLEEDASELLEKRLGKKTCCGDGYNKIFQVAQ